MDYLYSKESTFWDGDKLNINGKDTKVKFIHSEFNNVVRLSDLLNYVWLTDTSIEAKKKADGTIDYNEEDELKITEESQTFDINIVCKITVKAQIDEDKTKTHKMYQVIF